MKFVDGDVVAVVDVIHITHAAVATVSEVDALVGRAIFCINSLYAIFIGYNQLYEKPNMFT